MRLVVSVDSSATSDLVVGEIVSRPWPPASEVTILHVLDTFAATSGFVYSDRLAGAEDEAAQALVESAAQLFRSAGLRATARVTEGYAKTAIIDYATEWGADLVVVGSHGRGAVYKFLLGSVAAEVVRAAQCSVEIVRSVPGRERKPLSPMRILVATDNSECSKTAARQIAARPWPEQSEFRVVSAIDTSLPAIEPWYGAQDVIARINDDRVKLAEEAAAFARNLLEAASLNVDAKVIEGSPKLRIVDIAKDWGADLVVVGSHGRRGIGRVLLGSVSESVALHAHCSVEVVRDKRTAGH